MPSCLVSKNKWLHCNLILQLKICPRITAGQRMYLSSGCIYKNRRWVNGTKNKRRTARKEGVTYQWLVTSAKQCWYPCSGSLTKGWLTGNVFGILFTCISNLIGKLTMAFLTGQSRHVLKSWYAGEGPEPGFWCCFADGLRWKFISIHDPGYKYHWHFFSVI